MRTNTKPFIVILLLFFFLLSQQYNASAFIERHYKLQEVIDACTNIVAGKVKSVDNKRLWVILQVEEDVLGKSGLEEIKINLAVGQRRSGTSPTTMVRYFKKGAPFVIFYDSHYGQLNSVGYVDGAWFQCKTHIGERPDWKKRWWTFTHIEIYMRRTFNGKATDLQKLVKNTLKKHNTGVLAQTPAPTFDKAGKNDIKVLVFTGFRCKTEFRTLCRFRKIGEYQFSFQETQNRQMPELSKVDILWIGQGVLRESMYFKDKMSEQKLKNFVKKGGVLIISGQDDYSRHTNVIPENFYGIERSKKPSIKPVKDASDIFKKPNKITGELYTNSYWTMWNRKYVVMPAFRFSGPRFREGGIAPIGVFTYGKGMYLITCLQNETFFQVSTNYRFMENCIYFAARKLKSKDKS